MSIMFLLAFVIRLALQATARDQASNAMLAAARTIVGFPVLVMFVLLCLVILVLVPFEIVMQWFVKHFRPSLINRPLRWWEMGYDVSVNVEGALLLFASVAIVCARAVVMSVKPRPLIVWLRQPVVGLTAAWLFAVALLVVVAVAL